MGASLGIYLVGKGDSCITSSAPRGKVVPHRVLGAPQPLAGPRGGGLGGQLPAIAIGKPGGQTGVGREMLFGVLGLV